MKGIEEEDAYQVKGRENQPGSHSLISFLFPYLFSYTKAFFWVIYLIGKWGPEGRSSNFLFKPTCPVIQFIPRKVGNQPHLVWNVTPCFSRSFSLPPALLFLPRLRPFLSTIHHPTPRLIIILPVLLKVWLINLEFFPISTFSSNIPPCSPLWFRSNDISTFSSNIPPCSPLWFRSNDERCNSGCW